MKGGFKEGDLVAISGKPGSGKTSWAQTLTYHLSKQGTGVMFMSYEVLIEYVWEKFQSMGLEKNSVVYSPLKMTSGGLDWVEKKILEAIEKYGIKCVVLDDLSFLLPPKQKYNEKTSSNYAAFLAGICSDLKLLALKNELIIILLAHVRKSEKLTTKSTMNDIADTSGVAQKSDYVFMVERELDKSAGSVKLNIQTNKMEERQNLFTDETVITLAKNRATGQTFSKKFKMVNELLIPQ
jgi:predicted ATP-dependent serine protease